MKKIIGFLLALAIMISMVPTSLATETELREEYFSIPVEYSNTPGIIESLNVMILGDHVYADAETLGNCLGYKVRDLDGSIAYISTGYLGARVVQFEYNSTEVCLFSAYAGEVTSYKAPFAPIKNDAGCWVPFEYTVLMMNSSMLTLDDGITLSSPTENIIDYFLIMKNNTERFQFDWSHDVGYTQGRVDLLTGSSHTVNVFNGLLSVDLELWGAAFAQYLGSSAGYDYKNGRALAMLMCMESDNM